MLRSSTYFPRRFDQRLQAWCSLGREVYRLREVLEAYATTEAVCALTAEDIDEMDALLAAIAQQHG
jgi:chemotaxis methyl-accepting protein methylase